MYKLPYLLIKHLITSQIADIKTFEWYADQDTPKHKGGVVISPACYIRFYPTGTKSLQHGIQAGNLEFDLILITDNLYDNDKKIANTTGINHLDLANTIHQKLSGKGGKVSDIPTYSSIDPSLDYTLLNTIDRTQIATEYTNATTQKTTQRFTCFIKDYSGQIKFTKAIADLEIQDLSLE